MSASATPESSRYRNLSFPTFTTMKIFDILLRDITLTSLATSKHSDLLEASDVLLQLVIDGDFVKEVNLVKQDLPSLGWKTADEIKIQTNFDSFSVVIISVVRASGESCITRLNDIVCRNLLEMMDGDGYHGHLNDSDGHPVMELQFMFCSLIMIPGNQDLLRIQIHSDKDTPSSKLQVQKHCHMLQQFARLCLTQFQSSQDLDYLNQAISLFQYAVSLVLLEDPKRSDYLGGLGYSLMLRFDCLGKLDDLNRSILALDTAVNVISDANPRKQGVMSNLGYALSLHFHHTGNLDNITHSVSILEKALRLGDPNDLACLTNLGNALYQKSERLDNLDDLNKSISVFKKVVELTSNEDFHKATSLTNLGGALLSRFSRLHNIDDLNESVLIKQKAVELSAAGSPHRVNCLNNLANSLLHRYEQLGNMSDINDSISMFELVVELASDGNSERPLQISNLGIALQQRFVGAGDLGDINRSILLLQEAIDILPDIHPSKPSIMGNLGNSLVRRFEHLGDVGDINRSIQVLTNALGITPPGHSYIAACYNNLGGAYLCKFDLSGNRADIEKAIIMLTKANEATDNLQQEKLSRMSNLGGTLLKCFDKFGNLKDLDNSIPVLDQATKLALGDHPHKGSCLSNLGSSLSKRFERQHCLNDINKSIEVLEEALNLTPVGHPNRGSVLYNLGGSQFQRYMNTSSIIDIESAIQNLSAAATSKTTAASHRFSAASTWADAARAIENHQSRFEAYGVAIELLPELAWLGLSVSDRHHHLLEAGNVVREAAAAALNVSQNSTAVEWLEQGRSIIWGQKLQLRTPLDDLERECPKLAMELKQISRQLESLSTGDDNNLVVQQSHDLAHKREELLKTIRTKEGFHNFLKPKVLPELLPAATGGPIIIVNASLDRCDSLILLPDFDDIVHIPLDQFSHNKALQSAEMLAMLLKSKSKLREAEPDRGMRLALQHQGQKDPEAIFQTILSQLWVGIVRPILDGIAIISPSDITSELPHIYWCLTGPLAFLPMHAAGLYSEENSGLGNKLSDLAVSSYIPSLISLLNGHKSEKGKGKTNQMLAVALPAESRLPGAGIEIEKLKVHIEKFPLLELLESKATIEAVTTGLKKSSWVHFACHGIQDISNPTESALLLAEHSQLTLSTISNLLLPHAQIVFLSACQTATGDKDLAEEAIHLAAGMLLAGFRGAIGTMWSISDHDAPEVADSVYAHIFKDNNPDAKQAAYALHVAIRKLQEENTSYFSWVPFIHLGV